MAPERRKERNDIFEWTMPIIAKTMDKLFLSLESVSGYDLPFFLDLEKREVNRPRGDSQNDFQSSDRTQW